MRHRRAIAWMLRLILAILLAITGIGKLLDRHEASQFIVTLTNANPVVEKRGDALIIGLSIFEIVLAGALLHRRSVRIGLLIFSGILALFSSAMGIVLVRGRSLDSCGCFGAFGGEMSLEIALLRNLLLLVAALGCYLLLVSTTRADVNTHSFDTPKLP